ncbi:MAG: DUF3857 domain-containing protein [Prevotellaceae bacterium]|jgi:hypothetical protein|nr:DUF3857 domain-containing protein [Prevotellaceae bacterium]
MKQKLLLFLLFLANFVSAQNYAVSTIADSLKTDAFAVVRECSEEFVQNNSFSGTYKNTLIITVLNKNGDNFADFVVSEDTFNELKKFSGEIFDENGKSIKKIKQSELITTAYSEHLATTDKRTFYNLHTPKYPFTVKYTYEMAYKNGILSYPPFVPIQSFNIAIEKAEYSLQVPKNQQIRERQENIKIEKSVSENDAKIYKYSVKNLKALPNERFCAEYQIIPVVYLSPEKFCVEKTCGDMSSWQTFGKWQSELIKGRNSLPQSTIDKVLELTSGISDRKQKVKILYEFMQKTTHYVSIQLGIGGWQPMFASAVAKTGFGDCKALSNYMKSLLEVADIQSFYTPIRTGGKKSVLPDFPNFSQFNHVILAVPLENDTVWLECTSQTLPFGYVHSGIAGHEALIVGQDTAFICTLPQKSPLQNREINVVNITLSPEGHANLEVNAAYTNSDFERVFFGLKGLSAKEENEFLGKLIKVPKPQISNFKKTENLSEKPSINLSFSVDCQDFASKTDSRMFFTVNPSYTSLKGRLTGKTRKFDIVFETGFSQSDTINIDIPENYFLENKPKDIEISSKYGNFKSQIVEKENVIIYTQTLELLSGHFSVTEFEAIKAFFDKVENAQTAKITIKKLVESRE